MEVARSEMSASRQLMFFVLGANDTGSSLSLLNDTFVSEGCALTHSRGEVTVGRTRGFIVMLVESG